MDTAYDAIRSNKHANLFLSPGGDHREEEAHELFDDSQGGVHRAPSYRHADEIKCDQHMETFIKCIKASGG